MNWNYLTDEGQLQEIISQSQTKPQVIFKHSTRCSISAVALQRMQKAKQPDGLDFYFLDLLAHRPLSNKVAEVFGVHHESPQVLLIKDGKCIFDESHLGISMNDLVAEAM
ncbi:bacillithiol system redox-active protein YtxJ [Flavisolibacter ginsenosidimutans]|uniref:Bacillithiol system redox-active protein YtxJ n=1 Tax=Flavisolibacter ginsenosidimutans TaxID=661481 RepID=A0A5B8UGC0_9BACT|nr:bacillithiol system redox-active protein YtxJ [Flavisolibacter ginsenosidimutans]QEC55356.1 bacillithiol system redox-active protein YtxJ [Flavisolibacter ginsenosidimutans]